MYSFTNAFQIALEEGYWTLFFSLLPLVLGVGGIMLIVGGTIRLIQNLLTRRSDSKARYYLMLAVGAILYLSSFAVPNQTPVITNDTVLLVGFIAALLNLVRS